MSGEAVLHDIFVFVNVLFCGALGFVCLILLLAMSDEYERVEYKLTLKAALSLSMVMWFAFGALLMGFSSKGGS